MNENYIVKKSNYFIMNSSYDLSLQEQKIILTLASMVKLDDKEFKPYIFSISEFMNLLEVDTKTKYNEIPKITKELMKKVFEIRDGNTLIQTAWLAGAKYIKGSGYVELIFSPYLKPYMLQLNSMFTQYKLMNVLSMKSKYSSRIYEFLKCNEFKKQGFIIIDISELRQLLKAIDIYPFYADFKKKIILQAQKELKNLTDIKFDFEEIKTGRKVTAIKFYINSNQIIKKTNEIEQNLISDEIQPDTHISKNLPAAKPLVNLPPVIAEIPAKSNLVPQPESVIDIDDLLDTLRNIIKKPLKTKELKEILAVANNDLNLINSKYELSQNKDIDDLKSWIINAIKNDYKEPVKPESIKHTESPVIQSSASAPDETLIEAVRNIIKEPIPNNDIKAILDIAHGNLDIIMDKYSLVTKCKINNITGFLISAISKDYSENYIPSSPSHTRPLNRFTNYPQRVYDFPKMEALEMELNKMEYNQSMAKESEEAERLKSLKESEEAETLKKLKESEEAERLKRHEESEKHMASIIEREKREALEKVEEQKRFRRRKLFLNLQYAQLENNFEEAERIQAEMDSI